MPFYETISVIIPPSFSSDVSKITSDNLKGLQQAMENHAAFLPLLAKPQKLSEKEIVFIFVQGTCYKSAFNIALQGFR